MIKRIILLLALVSALFSAQGQIFYRVSGKDLSRPSYIFGTHHLASLALLDSLPGVMNIIDNVDNVVGEIDMIANNQMQLAMKLQSYMMAPADSTLKDVLGDRYAVASTSFQEATGMPLDMFNAMRPMVANTLVTLMALQKDNAAMQVGENIDTQLQSIGSERGKHIVGLEQPEEQAALLYNYLPVRVQADMLMESLKNPDKILASTKRLNEAYLAGNIEELYSMTIEEEEDGDFMNELLTKRNQRWLEELPEIMKGSPSLIVVGALHLAGPQGLVKRLREMGYTVDSLPR